MTTTMAAAMSVSSRSSTPIMDAYAVWENEVRNHRAGTFPTDVLRMIERTLPRGLQASAETGCGKSTILLSNLSQHHAVFCLDDQSYGQDSSVNFFRWCPLTREDRIELVFGPSQMTLPRYVHSRRYDLVIIDGPHGWPFPELEYFYFYPHIAHGGLLVLDDCQIPTIGRLADILAEDPMWHLEGFISTTGLFRRTDAPLFDPFGDGWWEQPYNRRRIAPTSEFYLGDRPPLDRVSSLSLSRSLNASPND